MHTFEFAVPVETELIVQVQADNEEDALRLLAEGEFDTISEEAIVEHFDKPDLLAVYDEEGEETNYV